MINQPNVLFIHWLTQFERVLKERDFETLATLFHEEIYWRDLVSFTWNIKTFEGKEAILAMLNEVLSRVDPHAWKIAGDAKQEGEVVHGGLTFETNEMLGEGYLRLVNGKCWTLLTSAAALKKHRGKRVEVDTAQIRNWKSAEASLRSERIPQLQNTYCLIIGGGQCGIALGARLRQLEVPHLIIDKYARPGDAWRKRYDALSLHDPVWTHHLPYVPFPHDWPLFPHKDQLADWLEAYTHAMELDYCASTECLKAHYNEDQKRWEVLVSHEGQQKIIHTKQLVLATGMSGLPLLPNFPGSDQFKGEQYHSTRFKSSGPYAQKKCIVLGSNNSAHDICADLQQHGADVTMIQPSSSSVVRLDTLVVDNFRNYCNAGREEGMTTHKADLIGASIPYKVKAAQSIEMYKKIKQKDAVFYEQLKKAGFLLDFGEDESGISMKYHRRGSGYYMNVGASELIIDGKIKLKSGQNISLIKEGSVVFTDGSELPADLIVYATGFRPMHEWIAHLISPEVADKVGLCWGIGSNTKKDPGPWEGELRNMWKPTKQQALWIHGGNLSQSRFYSMLLAMQIKARMEGLPTPLYE